MYGPDVNNIIAVVNAITLQIQTQEGPKEHEEIKQSNESFVTTKVWESLEHSGETKSSDKDGISHQDWRQSGEIEGDLGWLFVRGG